MSLYAAVDVRRLVLLMLMPTLAAGGLTACNDEKPVQVGFRPEAGATYRYEIKVQSVTSTVIGDEAPERSVDEVTLESRDTVLSAAPEEVKVRVELRRAGSPDRTFQVRFDRGAQLSGVDAVDGLPPGEGVFLPCSFWLVCALAMIGRLDEARQLFERLLALRNDVGLLSEAYDPDTGRLVGNFPQAFTHVGLLRAAGYLAERSAATEGRRHEAEGGQPPN